MADSVMIHWCCDGAEHDETWPSLDAFLSWCAAEGIVVQWTAYACDEDGEWVPFARG